MAIGDHGRLEGEQVSAGVLGQRQQLRGARGRQRDAGHRSCVHNGADPRGDEVVLDRFLVQLLQDPDDLLGGGGGDALQRFARIVVPGLDALKVEHRQGPQL